MSEQPNLVTCPDCWQNPWEQEQGFLGPWKAVIETVLEWSLQNLAS